QPTRRGTPRTSSRPERKRVAPASGGKAPRPERKRVAPASGGKAPRPERKRVASSAGATGPGKTPAIQPSSKDGRFGLRVHRGTPSSASRISLDGSRPAQKGSPARVADGRRSGAERAASGVHVRHVIVVAIVVAAIALAALLGWLFLSYTPAFTINEVAAESTEHVSSENIIKLANIPSGSTLLNLDEASVTANLRKNPWVGEVSYVREFPSTLKITITERTVDSLVVMSTGNMAWCLGNGNVWIEPVSISVGEGRSVNEAALAKAREMGALLITGVPPSISPVAGSKATDEVLDAIEEYRRLFSEEFSAQIVSFSASGLDSISCVLASGVEISLGPATNVETKESVARELLAKYAGKITYINVRVPSKPSYRMVSSDNVQQGSGTEGTDYPDPATSPSTTTSSSGNGAGKTTGESTQTSDGGQGSATSSSQNASGDGASSASDGNGGTGESDADGSVASTGTTGVRSGGGE
ncbi:MAG: FtsQ-type POTRA domain-containing protein, partial [Olsenella sp.]|nr:FtsQ-type POTRA domain-containing protein [Olsenella sp.]